MEVVLKLQASVALPREESTLPNGQGAVWAPERVWTFGRGEKSLILTGMRTSHCPARSLITVWTEIYRYCSGEWW